MDNLNTVFWILMTVSAIGVIAFLGTLAAWGVRFFGANRPVRVQRHETIPSYYGRMVISH